MQPIYQTFRPQGFGTINAYLFIERPQEIIDFYIKAFHAEELDRTVDEQGIIKNCIMKIGDSCFMLSQAAGDFKGMRTAFYLFTDDPDALQKNALENGALEIFPPADTPYQDRQGGVMDPAGNYWWISKRLVEQGY